MTDKIKLEDILPLKAEFVLVKHPGKTFHIRTFDLRDTVWVEKEFGKNLGQVLAKEDWADIARVIYHQLDEKEDFLLTVEKEIDDMGRRVEVEVSGPEKLIRSVKTQEESNKLIGALTRAIADSNPLMKDLVESEIKKKLKSLNQIGAKSSIPLRRSTGTPLKKSAG